MRKRILSLLLILVIIGSVDVLAQTETQPIEIIKDLDLIGEEVLMNEDTTLDEGTTIDEAVTLNIEDHLDREQVTLDDGDEIESIIGQSLFEYRENVEDYSEGISMYSMKMQPLATVPDGYTLVETLDSTHASEIFGISGEFDRVSVGLPVVVIFKIETPNGIDTKTVYFNKKAEKGYNYTVVGSWTNNYVNGVWSKTTYTAKLYEKQEDRFITMDSIPEQYTIGLNDTITFRGQYRNMTGNQFRVRIKFGGNPNSFPEQGVPIYASGTFNNVEVGTWSITVKGSDLGVGTHAIGRPCMENTGNSIKYYGINPQSVITVKSGYTPPTKPQTITAPTTIRPNETFNVSWTASAGSGSISYETERQINGNNTWESIYKGTNRSYSDKSLGSWEFVRYRVRATDENVNSDWSYSEIIRIVNNTAPTIKITNPAVSQIIRGVGTITISGTVTDPDTNTLTISATMGGRTKSTTVTAPATNKAWSLTWSGSELAEGTYNTIPVTVSDGTVTATANHTGVKIVDKTNPTIKVNIK